MDIPKVQMRHKNRFGRIEVIYENRLTSLSNSFAILAGVCLVSMRLFRMTKHWRWFQKARRISPFPPLAIRWR